MSDSDHAVVVVSPAAKPPATSMHPLVELALARGTVDPATLRELLGVQREWEAGEAKKAYTVAMVALKRDLPAVLDRDSQVDYTGDKGRVHFRHTSLAAAVDAAVPHLSEHGFSHGWIPRTDKVVEVTCTLTHEAGHSESTTIAAPPDSSGRKSPAQAVASTITLLQRYTLLSLLGLATRDHTDPDPPDATPRSGVDVNRNMRACARLLKLGKTREQAEEFAGRPMPEWTSDDIERIAKWVEPQAKADSKACPECGDGKDPDCAACFGAAGGKTP